MKQITVKITQRTEYEGAVHLTGVSGESKLKLVCTKEEADGVSEGSELAVGISKIAPEQQSTGTDEQPAKTETGETKVETEKEAEKVVDPTPETETEKAPETQPAGVGG